MLSTKVFKSRIPGSQKKDITWPDVSFPLNLREERIDFFYAPSSAKGSAIALFGITRGNGPVGRLSAMSATSAS